RRGRGGGANAFLGFFPPGDRPPPLALERLAHEYELRNELDGAWAARPLEFVREDGRAMLGLEDPGGEPPACLLGLPTRLPRERQTLAPPETIAGTLAYMAPEQTGRMNRSIDSRSDLYSLGVAFYEMLTGTLPFSAADPMEWIHCHIARLPIPPSERVAGVPAQLSAIVMKLLAKAAEERYQTTAGLEADLQRCLTEWEARRRIDLFQLGVHDVSDRLLLPEK